MSYARSVLTAFIHKAKTFLLINQVSRMTKTLEFDANRTSPKRSLHAYFCSDSSDCFYTARTKGFGKYDPHEFLVQTGSKHIQ